MSGNLNGSRQLQELQAKRIAARQAALDEAVALRNLHKMKGQPSEAAPDDPATQFVFSTAEIEREARRQNRRAHPYNLAQNRESALQPAA